MSTTCTPTPSRSVLHLDGVWCTVRVCCHDVCSYAIAQRVAFGWCLVRGPCLLSRRIGLNFCTICFNTLTGTCRCPSAGAMATGCSTRPSATLGTRASQRTSPTLHLLLKGNRSLLHNPWRDVTSRWRFVTSTTAGSSVKTLRRCTRGVGTQQGCIGTTTGCTTRVKSACEVTISPAT